MEVTIKVEALIVDCGEQQANAEVRIEAEASVVECGKLNMD